MADDDPISPEILSQMLMRMFEFAPVAMAITTSSLENSSYVKVNDAYLRMTGLEWDAIKGKRVTTSGTFANPARIERRRLLDEEGGYQSQEVELTHVDGTAIPTLISAQRTVVGEHSYDVEIIVDISLRTNLQREMDRRLVGAALTDALTGLPNRAAYDAYISKAIADAGHDKTSLLLAFVDLNGFKHINDTRGHAAGDQVLEAVAQRLLEGCRESDFVARLGGDEFVVVLSVPGNNLAVAFPAFQRMMQKVFVPVLIDATAIEIGAAIGTTAFDPANDTAETLLNRADRYMYEAKSTGNIFHVVSDADLSTAQIERVRQRVG